MNVSVEDERDPEKMRELLAKMMVELVPADSQEQHHLTPPQLQQLVKTRLLGLLVVKLSLVVNNISVLEPS